jgi:D-glycero-D-manno-heptose 1,7-bisphosphate phosphatase
MTMNRAVFLDRDGTLMLDVPYCSDPAKVQVLPGVTESLKRLKEQGFGLVVVTNQSGIGRGYFGEETFWEVQAAFEQQIGHNLIDATYFCGDHPNQASYRRKPAPGMLIEAAGELGLDLASCFMIGNSESDIEAGIRAGVKATIRIGPMAKERQERVWAAKNFPEAVDLILASELREAPKRDQSGTQAAH